MGDVHRVTAVMEDWRKSSYSGSNGGECAEVASSGGVAVRDTKDHGCGPVLTFSAEAWDAFLGSLR
jgi:hypothetical protein